MFMDNYHTLFIDILSERINQSVNDAAGHVYNEIDANVTDNYNSSLELAYSE